MSYLLVDVRRHGQRGNDGSRLPFGIDAADVLLCTLKFLQGCCFEKWMGFTPEEPNGITSLNACLQAAQ